MRLKTKYPIALRPPLSTADLVQHYDLDEVETEIKHLARCCYQDYTTHQQEVIAFHSVLHEMFNTCTFKRGAETMLWRWWSKGWQDASYGAKP